MSDAIRGTIEILIGQVNPESRGFLVTATLPESVPGTATRNGYSGIVEVPPQRRANQIPAGEWKALNDEGKSVRIVLWAEIPFDDTLIGKALARALEPPVDVPQNPPETEPGDGEQWEQGKVT